MIAFNIGMPSAAAALLRYPSGVGHSSEDDGDTSDGRLGRGEGRCLAIVPMVRKRARKFQRRGVRPRPTETDDAGGAPGIALRIAARSQRPDPRRIPTAPRSSMRGHLPICSKLHAN